MTAVHELLGDWESYYVIIGGSAAALTGLQFVVIALIAEAPEHSSADTVGAFGTPTVVHFCASLFVAAVLSAPWPQLNPAIWLLAATGCAGLLYALIVLRRALRQTDYRPVLEDWLWHGILPMLVYGSLLAAALLFHRDPAAALFGVAGVALALIFIGIHNAWDSVAYVAVQRRSKRGAD